jgi:hypothetical protein
MLDISISRPLITSDRSWISARVAGPT